MAQRIPAFKVAGRTLNWTQNLISSIVRPPHGKPWGILAKKSKFSGKFRYRVQLNIDLVLKSNTIERSVFKIPDQVQGSREAGLHVYFK
jgi:hypothetical protein